MNLIPYLTFEGNAEEVMKFYADVFGGEINQISRYEEMQNMDIPEHYKDKVLHGRLKFGNNLIYFSDTFPGQKVNTGSQISLSIEFESEAQIDQVYEKLSQHGQIKMPLEKTFWGAKYAKLTDRFGVPWNLNYQL
jgi:PhnB protein